jgi:asparagine synthase (glutamine-hydrolysing)
MCGIAGVIRFGGATAELPVLQEMASRLTHRGPDGEGFHIAGPVGFAHRRLAIIDPTGGAQPLVDRASGVALTYNGEVYNFIELRRDVDDGAFATASDTEVVLRAWRRWGMASLDRMRGMFAFALYDPRADKVFLVRDRLGIKPLYYRADDGGVAFASELQALLPALEQVPAIDHQALSLYLRYGYVPTPLTIYRGVQKLEPGYCLEVDINRGRVRKHRYWQLIPRVRRRSEAQALAELEALLTETIRLYVRSDVAFGAFLSGGVDSSLVTALMSEVLNTPVRSFSIGFAERDYSELPYAEEAARRLGTRHRSAVLAPNLPRDFLQSIAARFGEPFADSSCLPTWYVSRIAATEVKMVLSGDGGDELFAGYWSYPAVLAQSKFARMRPIYAAYARLAPGGANAAATATRSIPWSATHHHQRDMFRPTEREQLTGRPAARVDDEAIRFPVRSDPVTRCQLRDIRSYLLDDILVKVDRMSMANSLEVRVPLLDHHLVEFAFSLPIDMRLRDNGDAVVGKYLLKRTAERFFPRAFLDRPKKGFGIPIHTWLEGALRPIVRDLLESDATSLASLVDPNTVRTIVGGYYAGRQENVAKLWGLFALRLWMDTTRLTAATRQAERAVG